jgi:hypothetical protein
MDRRYIVKYYASDESDPYWKHITCRTLEEAEQTKEDLEMDGWTEVTIEMMRI